MPLCVYTPAQTQICKYADDYDELSSIDDTLVRWSEEEVRLDLWESNNHSLNKLASQVQGFQVFLYFNYISVIQYRQRISGLVSSKPQGC